MLDQQLIPFKLYDRVGSTQSEARLALENGEAAPFWILAHQQTKGRGRSGRHWQSAHGNYSGSLVWPMPEKKADASKFSFVLALALANVFEGLGLGSIDIKWPNDVLIGMKKIAGILLEAEGEFLIMGVGVNLKISPATSSLDQGAIGAVALGELCSIEFLDFHALLSSEVQKQIESFEKYGFLPVRNEIKSRLLVRENMIYDDGRQSELVRPEDIGMDGQLIVRAGNEKKEIFAGDLWLTEDCDGFGH